MNLRRGIMTCLCVSSSRLAEAESLLAGGYVTGAGVVFSFAVEEFGKAVMLREAFRSGIDPVVVEGFYDHRVKFDAASKLIPTEYLRLTDGPFQAGVFEARVFDVGTLASVKTRLDWLYVDWYEGEWQYGAGVVPGVLKDSIEAVQIIVSKASGAWPEATSLP
jgi:AbiV family abortive infection protein